MRWLIIISLMGSVVIPIVSESETVDKNHILLRKDDINVQLYEVNQYFYRHANSKTFDQSVNKTGAVKQVIGNLYILKRSAQAALDLKLFTEDEWLFRKRDAAQRVALERYLETMVTERMVKVDWENLAKAEYAAKKAEFVAPKEVRAAHLLIASDDRSFEEFVARVAVVTRAINEERDFSDIAKHFSDESATAENGGDLGFFSKGEVLGRISDVAFSMSTPDQIVGPVLSRFGAHFIQYKEERGGEVQPFDSVKRSLIATIKKTTSTRIRDELVREIRAEVEQDLEQIDELMVRKMVLGAR